MAWQALFLGEYAPDSASQTGDPSALLSCYGLMDLPDIKSNPLGPLDAGTWEAWLRSNPGLFRFSSKGYVSMSEQTVSTAVARNAFKPDELASIEVKHADIGRVGPARLSVG
jgi:hypothetical protein